MNDNCGPFNCYRSGISSGSCSYYFRNWIESIQICLRFLFLFDGVVIVISFPFAFAITLILRNFIVCVNEST